MEEIKKGMEKIQISISKETADELETWASYEGTQIRDYVGKNDDEEITWDDIIKSVIQSERTVIWELENGNDGIEEGE